MEEAAPSRSIQRNVPNIPQNKLSDFPVSAQSQYGACKLLLRMDDQRLLQRFCESRSEDAFRKLVTRHADMVLGVAVRRSGNRALADEVAQNVFTGLAQKAGRLTGHATITGWLYRSTLNECTMAFRRNHAHTRKMNEFSEHLESRQESCNVWQEALPELDEAINKLPDSDRDLILLRFGERKSFREIGDPLGKSEAAAQNQVERALQRLSQTLRQRGVTASVAVIAAVPLTMQWNKNRELQNELSRIRNTPAPKAERIVIPAPVTPAVAQPATKSKAVAVAPEAPRVEEQDDTWKAALREADPVLRTQRIAALLKTLTGEDGPRVAEVFALFSANGQRFTEEYRLFLRAWGRLDGAAAVAHLAPAPEAATKSSNLLAAIAGWASVNPQAARAWIEQVPNKNPREDLIYGLLDGWSMTDFAAASAYAETRPRSPARNRFRDLLLKRSLASGGIAAAQNWFMSIADNEHNSLYKHHAFDEVIEAMLYRDPAAAAQWISLLADQKYMDTSPVVKTASALAKKDPVQAMHWLQSMSAMDTKHLTAGHHQLLTQWSKRDPVAAGTWLTRQRDNPHYDGLAGSFAGNIASVEPDTALEWAQSIGNEKLREQTELKVASRIYASEAGPQKLASAGYSSEFIKRAGEYRSPQQEIRLVSFPSGGAGGGSGQFVLTQPARRTHNSYSIRLDEELGNSLMIEGAGDLASRSAPNNPHGNLYRGMSCSDCHQQQFLGSNALETARRAAPRTRVFRGAVGEDGATGVVLGFEPAPAK
tara:strand:- start:7520 stop:9817 length:2298 start_codon:yes stop_codon:yes gene_type:complete